ncbi:MAG: hypothetical protein NT062_12370 [Proteobacteria bacterium]|nr:hypothetical protein [Pseudomonadota bacterium]
MMKLRSLIPLVVLASSTIAQAGGIVLESYTRQRPSDADTYVGPLLDTLAKDGFSTGSDVNRKYETEVSRPSLDKQGLPLDFARQIDAGFDEWRNGKYSDAIGILAPLVDLAAKNAGAFADSPGSRDALRKAEITIALSHDGLGDARSADAAFLEIMRSFPEERLAAGTYGSAANKRFDELKRRAARGRLTVTTTNDAAVIYIDEHIETVGTTSKDGIVAGEYRVFAQLGKQKSRTHTVIVPPNGDARLTIDVALDQTVRTASWTGLVFAEPAERAAAEPVHAAAFAKAIHATSIAVVGIDQTAAGTSVIGALVGTDGKVIRWASVPVTKASKDQLKKLAKFIVGEDSGEGLDLQQPAITTAKGDALPGPREHDPARAPLDPDGRWGGWKWIAAVAAIGALGTGGYLLAIDNTCPHAQPAGTLCADLYETRTSGLVALGGGALIGGLAVYLFVSDGGHGHDPHRATGARLTPTRGGALASYAFAF